MKAEKVSTNRTVIVMATLTLSYNPRNKNAQKTLDYILSLGYFHKEEPTKKSRKSWLADDFRGAMKEVKLADEGKIKLGTLEDLLNEL